MAQNDTIPEGWQRTRTCGSCRMCCKAMGVVELDKPAGEWCPNAGDFEGGGCGIYETRPKSCDDFFCAWINDYPGLFTDEDRPDRLGVVFWVAGGGGVHPTTGEPISVLVAQEGTRGDAMNRPRVRKLIKRLRRRGAPVSVGFGTKVVPVALTRDGEIVLDVRSVQPAPGREA